MERPGSGRRLRQTDKAVPFGRETGRPTPSRVGLFLKLSSLGHHSVRPSLPPSSVARPAPGWDRTGATPVRPVGPGGSPGESGFPVTGRTVLVLSVLYF